MPGSSPSPLEILTFNPAGSVLAVRPFCRNADYWQVFFDVNRTIAQVLLHEQIPARA